MLEHCHFGEKRRQPTRVSDRLLVTISSIELSYGGGKQTSISTPVSDILYCSSFTMATVEWKKGNSASEHVGPLREQHYSTWAAKKHLLGAGEKASSRRTTRTARTSRTDPDTFKFAVTAI